MSTPIYFADLYGGAGVVCRRLGLSKLHILDDDGALVATYRKRPGCLARIDRPRYVPGEPAVNVGLVLACGGRVVR